MATEAAVVTLDGSTWSINEGQLLAYGRSEDRHIRIDDNRVSSRAGVLFVRSGYPWVRHDSTSHAITVVRSTGERHVIHQCPPDSAVGVPEPLPGPRTRLELYGTFRTIMLEVDASGLPGPLTDQDGAAAVAAATERTEIIRDELTEDDRRVLAALDETMLRSGKVGRPRDTRTAAHRLGVSPKSLEHRLLSVREKLTGLGVGGLLRDDLVSPDDGRSLNYVDRLGRLAFDHGWVLPDDLALLPPA